MGNKLGWIIAGVLLIALLVVFVVMAIGTGHSEPTRATLKAGFMDVHAPKASAALVLGTEPDGAGNAAEDYAKAVEFYKTNRHKLDYAQDARPITDLLERLHGYVAAGARKQKMRYVLEIAPKELQVGYQCEPAVYMRKIDASLHSLATAYAAAGQDAKAIAVLKDLFAMGWHMMKERARAHMVYEGMRIQQGALPDLAALYRRTSAPAARTADLQKYADSLQPALTFYEEKHRVVWSPKPNPGDIFNVVEHEKDRAWLVQAVMALGVVRYTADESRDAKYAERLLGKLAGSDDPLVAAAAKAARDMDQAGFNTVMSR